LSDKKGLKMQTQTEKYVKVCADCGLIVMATNGEGKDVCPVCDSIKFTLKPLPEKLHCCYCKREYTLEQLQKIWTTIPFYNAKDNTFYDGCYGWD